MNIVGSIIMEIHHTGSRMPIGIGHVEVDGIWRTTNLII